MCSCATRKLVLIPPLAVTYCYGRRLVLLPLIDWQLFRSWWRGGKKGKRDGCHGPDRASVEEAAKARGT